MLPEAGAPGAAPRPSWLRLGAFVLALVACYANSLRVPFLFDDPFLSPDEPDRALDYSTRPLVWATFDLNRALSGRDTTSYHVLNALVHLACGLLLHGILRRTLARAATAWSARTQADVAWVTTLLWLCHPLQTESVTYLSQRAESLGALFTLGVLYAVIRARDGTRPAAWHALACLSLALGFLTKETIATAPLLVLLYEHVFLGRAPLRALRASPGLYAGLAGVALVAAAALIVPLLALEGGSAGFKLREFTALDYLRTQPGVILHYLRLVFWPHPLCLDYAWPIARVPGEWVPQSLAILALLGGTLLGLLRRSWLGFAGAFFFLYLAPSSSVVPIRDPAVEHRLYLPLAAVLVVVVVATAAGLRRLARRPTWLGPALAGAALVALAALTIRRNRDYQSPEHLWRATAALAPHNARAHGNLGAVLAGEGRDEEALAALMRGFELAPEDGPILLNLGKLYARRGESERAIYFLRRGAARTQDARGIGSLGTTLFDKGDYAGAALYFREALQLAPEDAGAHFRLASALARLGRTEEALASFARALELAPDFQEARINLVAYLWELGRAEEALTHSEAALAQAPNTGMELHNHALLLDQLGRTAEAVDVMRQACAAEAELLAAHSTFAELVRALPEASTELREEALAKARRALELAGTPGPDLWLLVALCAADLGRHAEAIAAVDEALALTRADPAAQAELGRLRAELERHARE